MGNQNDTVNGSGYNSLACRRLAASVLIESVKDAAGGCSEARIFLTSERAQLFADAAGVHPDKLKTLAVNIDSVDLDRARALTRKKPAVRFPKLSAADKRRDERRARKILSREPQITGVDLGKRLGRSSSYGQQLKKQLLNE